MGQMYLVIEFKDDEVNMRLMSKEQLRDYCEDQDHKFLTARDIPPDKWATMPRGHDVPEGTLIVADALNTVVTPEDVL